MRFFQEIQRRPIRHAETLPEIFSEAAVRRHVRNAQRFVLDNVVRYVWTEAAQAVWTIESDFPNVAPPFPTMWFEWSYGRAGLPADIGTAGLLWLSERHEGAGWTSRAMAFTCGAGGTTDVVPFMKLRFDIGRDGNVTEASTGAVGPDAKPHAEADRDFIFATVVPPLMGLSLMHCKNVVASDHVAKEGSRQFRNARDPERFLRYHILEIEPMTRILTEAGAKSDLRQALHICRGHFKDYRQRGLFGRETHKGLYWFDAHVRGDAARGVVAKDYDVIPPDE